MMKVTNRAMDLPPPGKRRETIQAFFKHLGLASNRAKPNPALPTYQTFHMLLSIYKF
jgi:hypothetical protein